jgi:hypothetical protein
MKVLPIYKEGKPKLGDKRIIERFLWLPKFLGDDARWFTSEFIIQTYSMRFVSYWLFPGGYYRRGWVDKKWAV